MDDPIVIIGSGQAGAELALTLRRGGCLQPIMLFGEEPYLPYRRPALSKGYLLEEVAESELLHVTKGQLQKNNIEFKLGTRITNVNRKLKQVTLSTNEVLRYEKLVFATGGKPKQLLCSGAELENILYLRTLDDANILRNKLKNATRLVVVAGGFIGLEVAATARKHNINVTVLESGSRVLRRSTSEPVATFIAQKHISEGVKIETDKQVMAINSVDQKNVSSVVCSDGTVYAADVVVVGIGNIARVELARDAGLDVHRGILVNELGQTSDQDIYAIGDCANSVNRFYGYRLKLESVHGAMEQARMTATAILGARSPAMAIPSFWSDQNTLKFQAVGIPSETDRLVVRAYENGQSFAAFYIANGHLKAAHFVNATTEVAAARKLIKEKIPVTEQGLANPLIPLSVLLSDAMGQSQPMTA